MKKQASAISYGRQNLADARKATHAVALSGRSNGQPKNPELAQKELDRIRNHGCPNRY